MLGFLARRVTLPRVVGKALYVSSGVCYLPAPLEGRQLAPSSLSRFSENTRGFACRVAHVQRTAKVSSRPERLSSSRAYTRDGHRNGERRRRRCVSSFARTAPSRVLHGLSFAHPLITLTSPTLTCPPAPPLLPFADGSAAGQKSHVWHPQRVRGDNGRRKEAA